MKRSIEVMTEGLQKLEDVAKLIDESNNPEELFVKLKTMNLKKYTSDLCDSIFRNEYYDSCIENGQTPYWL